jgi:hypothetical protein
VTVMGAKRTLEGSFSDFRSWRDSGVGCRVAFYAQADVSWVANTARRRYGALGRAPSATGENLLGKRERQP